MTYDPKACTLCPRECRADRTRAKGACGETDAIRISKIAPHFYEEPPISGEKGSGAIFFCGCNLGCGYCQNRDISHGSALGKKYSTEALSRAMLELQESGVHNINLVTAAHFLPQVASALGAVKPELKIPVVYNSSGYEKAEALKLLDGLVDIYLPDFKYCSQDAAARYSSAPDYPEVAKRAIAEMVRQVGEYRERDGLAVRGVIIRHLVLPTLSRDGVEVMRVIADSFPTALVSVMSQYTPEFNRTGNPQFDRKIASLEYNRVLDEAVKLNLRGFMQERSSASAFYTPAFS